MLWQLAFLEVRVHRKDDDVVLQGMIRASEADFSSTSHTSAKSTTAAGWGATTKSRAAFTFRLQGHN